MTEKNNNRSLPNNVVDFLEYKRKKGLDTGDPSAIALAKKLVDIYEEHGSDQYYHVLIQATHADKAEFDLLMPYVTREFESRGYHLET